VFSLELPSEGYFPVEKNSRNIIEPELYYLHGAQKHRRRRNLRSAESEQAPQNGKENDKVSHRDRLSWKQA